MKSPSSTRSLRFAIVLCTLAALSAPARGLGAQTAKPFEALSISAQTLRDSVVQMARAQIGRRYRTGGETPEKGFDCSGLVSYVMAALDMHVPRTARLQGREGVAVSKDTSQLLPGDVLTFGKSKKNVSHVGIYVGNGRYVHASVVAGKVIETSINRPYSPLIKVWRGARRIVASSDSVPALAIIGKAPAKTNP
jgi:Cell wall-associated hydrolases (invasion-associated proteins)